MGSATFAVLLGSLGIIAALVALTFYLARRNNKAFDRALAVLEDRAKRMIRIDDLTDAVKNRDGILATLRDQLVSKHGSIKELRRQRDELLVAAEGNGDPVATANRINDRLQTLSELPDVQRATATAAPRNRPSGSAVPRPVATSRHVRARRIPGAEPGRDNDP